MNTNSAYLFAEIASAVTMILFLYDRPVLSRMLNRRFFLLAVALGLFWFLVEQIAIQLNIWHFTGDGTLGHRFARLPLEEYVFITLHISFTAALTIGLVSSERGQAL